MSLARSLMSSVTESVNIAGYDFSGSAIAESTWVDSACESLMVDICKVDKAFHTADIIGQVQVLQENANPEVLLEGMVKDGAEKIKNAFRKFWAKLKEWFNKVKQYFKSVFLTVKKFVKEFGKEIRDKKPDGFKYTAYKYTLDADSGNKVFEKVAAEIGKLVHSVEKVGEVKEYQVKEIVADRDNFDAYGAKYDGKFAAMGHQFAAKVENRGGYKNFNPDNVMSNLAKDAGLDPEIFKLSTSEYQDNFIKNMGMKSTDITELNVYLAASYRDGDEQESEWEDFESNSKEEMVSLIENGEKVISQIERDEKAFEKTVNDIIKAYDKVKATDAAGENAYKIAQKISGYLSALLTVGKVPSTVKVAAYKEAMSSYERILKSFLYSKVVKEGTDYSDGMADAPESLLEAAYKLL